MAVKTMAEKIYTAYLTGSEAEFFDSGISYTFTPEGLRDFITSSSSTVSWDDVTDKPTSFPTTWDEVEDKPSTFPSTWTTVSGKPTTFPPTIGTTATTAKAGNYQPTWAQVTGKPVGVAVANATDETDVVAQLNALLTSLRTAGFIGT